MRNLNERLPSEADRDAFAVPPLVDAADRHAARSARRPARASTSGARAPPAKPRSGRSIRRRWSTGQKQSARIASIEAGKSIDDVGERVRMLFNSKDKAGEFLRATLAPTLVYTARVTPEIAHSIDDVDRAMRWGFGWDLGPVRAVRRDRRQGRAARPPKAAHAMAGGVPPLIASLLEGGLTRFREGLVKPAAPDLQILRTREGTEPRHQEERGRQPGRSRRRRDRRRVPLEDERDRRRHHPDAAGRREGSREERPGAGRSATTRRTSPPAPT